MRENRKIRRFKAQIKFDGGHASPPFLIEAFSATGAAAKLASLISDQPREAIGFMVEEQTTILAASRMPSSPATLPPNGKLT